MLKVALADEESKLGKQDAFVLRGRWGSQIASCILFWAFEAWAIVQACIREDVACR